jgi:hypothetical protein
MCEFPDATTVYVTYIVTDAKLSSAPLERVKPGPTQPGT